MASVVFYVTLLVLVYCIYRYKRRKMYAMANQIGGTSDDRPIIGLALSVIGNAEHIMKKMVEYSRLTNDMGGISKSWLGPLLYYMITDPAAIEIVLKNNLEKDNLHRFLRFFLGNALIFAPVSIWKPRRKVAVPAFSPKIISSFVNIFAEQSDKLATLLKPKVGTGKFQIWPQINAYNLDSVMETAMGVPLNAQDNYDNPILKATNDAFKYTCERIFHPWLQPEWLYRLFPQYNKLKKATEIIHNFTNEVIERKRIQIKEMEKSAKIESPLDLLNQPNLTFLDLLIAQSGGSKGYNNVELREEVLTFILAATDTSAVTMGYTLKLLGKYPEIQQKVFDEGKCFYAYPPRG